MNEQTEYSRKLISELKIYDVKITYFKYSDVLNAIDTDFSWKSNFHELSINDVRDNRITVMMRNKCYMNHKISYNEINEMILSLKTMKTILNIINNVDVRLLPKWAE